MVRMVHPFLVLEKENIPLGLEASYISNMTFTYRIRPQCLMTDLSNIPAFSIDNDLIRSTVRYIHPFI